MSCFITEREGLERMKFSPLHKLLLESKETMEKNENEPECSNVGGLKSAENVGM